jgi:hypothetical protein
MWAASEGILVLLLVTALLGIFVAPRRTRSESRGDDRAKVDLTDRMPTASSAARQAGASQGVEEDYSASQKVTSPPDIAASGMRT